MLLHIIINCIVLKCITQFIKHHSGDNADIEKLDHLVPIYLRSFKTRVLDVEDCELNGPSIFYTTLTFKKWIGTLEMIQYGEFAGTLEKAINFSNLFNRQQFNWIQHREQET